MTKITPEQIDTDIIKLKSSVHKCLISIRNYKGAIEKERLEQEELRELVENPGDYKVEALERNVEACDKHIAEFEATIEGEHKAINEYSRIIKVLERKKCQLETML